MPTSLMIIDDFLQDPLSFRNAILKMEFFRPNVEIGYPGKNASKRIMFEGIEQEVSRLLNEPLLAAPNTSHGKPRITLEGETGSANIHIDNAHWSGILYLSLPEHCQGGTRFYKHKATDTDSAVLNPENLRKLGVSTNIEANKIINDILLNDSNDLNKWEKTMEVPMRFNRLVLLRPYLWHTASPGFGNSVENGRLMYPLFFKSAR